MCNAHMQCNAHMHLSIHNARTRARVSRLLPPCCFAAPFSHCLPLRSAPLPIPRAADPAYRPIPLTADPTYGRSHLRPIPLAAVITYRRSHLRPITLAADPTCGRSHLRPIPLAADPTCGRSHLRPIPLAADPTCGRSHLRPIPLAADPTCGRSHLRPIPLAADPTCGRSHLPALRSAPLRLTASPAGPEWVGGPWTPRLVRVRTPARRRAKPVHCNQPSPARPALSRLALSRFALSRLALSRRLALTLSALMIATCASSALERHPQPGALSGKFGRVSYRVAKWRTVSHPATRRKGTPGAMASLDCS
jgi:hypothetical protein